MRAPPDVCTPPESAPDVLARFASYVGGLMDIGRRWMGRRVWRGTAALGFASALLAGVALAGCGGGCELEGCTTGITLRADAGDQGLAGSPTVRACALDKCVQGHLRPSDRLTLPCPDVEEERDVSVTVVVKSNSGRVLLRDSAAVPLFKLEPNGSDCGPQCFVGRATIGVNGLDPDEVPPPG